MHFFLFPAGSDPKPAGSDPKMQKPILPFRRSQRVPERCAANDDVESITIIAGVSIQDREPDAIVSTTRAHYNREVGSMTESELGGNFRQLLSPRLLHLAKHTVNLTTGDSYL